MASSGKMDSGRYSCGRSNFSQTCSRLSLYLKEKGSFGELSLGLTPKFSESKGTVNFLHMIEKSGRSSGSGDLYADVNNLPQLVGEATQNKSDGGPMSEKQTGQMTIFYAGQVLVFDDLSADKAKEIMMLASNSCASRAALAPPLTAHRSVDSVAGAANMTTPNGLPERDLHVPQPVLSSDLPIARKNSLTRFLEKRKDRITANAPYKVTKLAAAAPPKPVKTEPWLGLAPQLCPPNPVPLNLEIVL